MSRARRSRWRSAWLALLTAAISGCAAILGGEAGVLDEGAFRDEDASNEVGSSPDAVGSDSPLGSDAGSDVNLDGDADANAEGGVDAGPPCPDAGGGPLVRAGGFCIDMTEVTVAQYTAFVAAKGGDISGQPAVCAGNTTYTPSMLFVPSNTDVRPIRFVDWCDAYMFCKWAGKRLCGGTDGGASAYANYAIAGQSQWYTACSHAGDGQHLYPYGNAYVPNLCSVDATGGAIFDAGGKTGCVGGYPGIFDMSGNVREWEDSCTPAVDGGPEFDMCHRRGGGSDDTPAGNACGAFYPTTRRDSTAHTGFRCCGP